MSFTVAAYWNFNIINWISVIFFNNEIVNCNEQKQYDYYAFSILIFTVALKRPCHVLYTYSKIFVAHLAKYSLAQFVLFYVLSSLSTAGKNYTYKITIYYAIGTLCLLMINRHILNQSESCKLTKMVVVKKFSLSAWYRNNVWDLIGSETQLVFSTISFCIFLLSIMSQNQLNTKSILIIQPKYSMEGIFKKLSHYGLPIFFLSNREFQLFSNVILLLFYIVIVTPHATHVEKRY